MIYISSSLLHFPLVIVRLGLGSSVSSPLVDHDSDSTDECSYKTCYQDEDDPHDHNSKIEDLYFNSHGDIDLSLG